MWSNVIIAFSWILLLQGARQETAVTRQQALAALQIQELQQELLLAQLLLDPWRLMMLAGVDARGAVIRHALKIVTSEVVQQQAAAARVQLLQELIK